MFTEIRQDLFLDESRLIIQSKLLIHSDWPSNTQSLLLVLAGRYLIVSGGSVSSVFLFESEMCKMCKNCYLKMCSHGLCPCIHTWLLALDYW